MPKELICSVLKIEKSCSNENKTRFGGSALHTIIKSEKTLKFSIILVEKFGLK